MLCCMNSYLSAVTYVLINVYHSHKYSLEQAAVYISTNEVVSYAELFFKRGNIVNNAKVTIDSSSYRV